MKSIEDLREWASDNTVEGTILPTHPVQHIVNGTLETLLRIADAIEAEHQKAEDEWKARDGQTWLRGYAECHAELMEGNEVIAADLEKAGWVRLPKDADGEHIQPSDIPYLTKANDGKRLAFCPSLELRQDGTWRLAGWTPDRYRISKPTVEDVLREFADEVWNRYCNGTTASDSGVRELEAEYAKRLRLAGEES